MKFASVVLLLVFLGAPLAGCGHHSDAPRMVGKEELDKLPQDENYKPSAKARKLRADGVANSLRAR